MLNVFKKKNSLEIPAVSTPGESLRHPAPAWETESEGKVTLLALVTSFPEGTGTWARLGCENLSHRWVWHHPAVQGELPMAADDESNGIVLLAILGVTYPGIKDYRNNFVMTLRGKFIEHGQ